MIYAVSHIYQKVLVNKYCFGSCGKILCAGVIIDGVGSFFACRQAECPHEANVTEVVSHIETDAGTEAVRLRKLKS